MLEQKYRKRKYIPLSELEEELDRLVREEKEKELQERVLRQLMYSDDSIEKLAIKALATGLINYLHYEEMRYTSSFRHKKGWFGHTTDEEFTSKRIRRIILER